MEAICLQDILRILPPLSCSSDLMPHAAAKINNFQDVNEWDAPSHETPSLLFFARMEERKGTPEYQRELSELLTRKFREFFP